MKVYKCDICKKEINASEVIERASWDRMIDLCTECNNTYNEAEKEIADMRQELRKEFEEKTEENIRKIMRNYKIDIWEEENEKESI